MSDDCVGSTEIRDKMCIDWDVPIEMDDRLILRADVFRPIKEGRYSPSHLWPLRKGLGLSGWLSKRVAKNRKRNTLTSWRDQLINIKTGK